MEKSTQKPIVNKSDKAIIQVRPVILCGGSGSRLWPLSRTGFPKQFLCLLGNESLFQQAIKRLMTLSNQQIAVSSPYIVTNEEHRFLALEQLRETGIEIGKSLLEPVGRNTTPALTLAALAALENGEDPVLVVTPADQTILDLAIFTNTTQQAIAHAAEGKIVIFGIPPDRPETGYGYIKTTKNVNDSEIALNVTHFVEKPDFATAQDYLNEGNYFWNAGIFVLKASIWIQALNRFRPDILAETQKAWNQRSIDGSFIRPSKTTFATIPSESIDYSVMERCHEDSSFSLVMLPLNAGWNDLGAWDAVWSSLPKDDAGNTHSGDVIAFDCHNTLVHATSRLVSIVGAKDIVVIETPDAVLIANKSQSQDIKYIVNELNLQERPERELHRKVHRPWGWYDSIDEDSRFKVKRIQVKSGASLSLQKHQHRAEHWIVVKGTAEVTCGEKTITLQENQSTYIPLGEIHRLKNPGKMPLEIIEVQSGSYLGEDDIVRLEDAYGRQQ